MGQGSYTYYIEDEFSIKNYPVIKQNGKTFQFNTVAIDEMNFSTKNLLVDYMNWEVDYFKKSPELASSKLSFNEIKYINQIETNFWKLTFPNVKNNMNYIPVKATYFLDFANYGNLYRLSFSSVKGDDNEAKELLYNHFKNINFYPNGINFDKLIENIKTGINAY